MVAFKVTREPYTGCFNPKATTNTRSDDVYVIDLGRALDGETANDVASGRRLPVVDVSMKPSKSPEEGQARAQSRNITLILVSQVGFHVTTLSFSSLGGTCWVYLRLLQPRKIAPLFTQARGYPSHFVTFVKKSIWKTPQNS